MLKKGDEKTTQPLALIVDDEPSICESLSGVLSDEGWKVVTAFTGKDGCSKLRTEMPDIVFLDVWMPAMDGIATLQKMKSIRDNVPIVIMSGHGTIETAVKATKLGAFDYLEKPLSIEKLLPMISHALQMKQLREGKSTEFTPTPIIGVSKAVETVTHLIETIAPRNSWVLITGENGTGKEVVARNIHWQSPRSAKPFVPVNCAAIPEELIESELFGHAKGAFTNAITTKQGKFEIADQGTLFLDEIGDMSLKTQAKILRILQERSFERLGDTATISVDVRVIAATNKDLQTEIKANRFREDLFHRLNVIPFNLEPLRNRTEDIPALVDHFLDLTSRELKEQKKSFSPEAMMAFIGYSWPGNIRELKNLIERLSIIVPKPVIDAIDLPPSILSEEDDDDSLESNVSSYSQFSAASFKQAKLDFERSFILEKLQEYQWNISKTAEAIGIERSHLHRKLRSFKIDPKLLKG